MTTATTADQGEAATGRPGLLRHRRVRGVDDPRDARRRRDLPDRPEHPRARRRATRTPRSSPTTSGTTSGPLALRHDLGRRPRAAHGRAALDRHRALHLALRAPPPRPGPRLHRRPARGRAVGRVRPLGHRRPRPRRAAGLRLARRQHRLVPALRRRRSPAPAARSSPPRIVLAVMVAADHHRDLPRDLPADPGPPRGGRARARRHALGDDPHGGAPVRPLGIVSAAMLGLGRALGETMAVAMVLSATGAVTFQLLTSANPSTIAANIALSFPEAYGIERQRADRDRPHPVHRHLRGQRHRPLDRQPPQGILGSQLMTITDDARARDVRRRRPSQNSLTAGRLPTPGRRGSSSAPRIAVAARGLRRHGRSPAATGFNWGGCARSSAPCSTSSSIWLVLDARRGPPPGRSTAWSPRSSTGAFVHRDDPARSRSRSPSIT